MSATSSQKPIFKRRWFVITLGVLVVLVIIGVASPKKKTPTTTTTTTTTTGVTSSTTARTGFKAIDGKALPGLPSNNWPHLSAASLPVGATDGQTSSSSDITYEVDIYNFSNATAETAFYKNPILPIPPGAGLVALMGTTGVSGTSEGFDLRECGGTSTYQAGGTCSGVGSSFSSGVVTSFQRGTTVSVIFYFSGSPVAKAQPSELTKNTKVAQSVISLLSTVGIN